MRLAALCAALALIAAPQARAVETQSGDTVAYAAPADDMVFLAGGELSITAPVGDDVIAAGGELSIAGASADHLIVAGGEVSVQPGQIKDVIGFAGDFTLSGGALTDDLILAAGRIDLKPDASIGGSAVITGGEIDIASPIGGDLLAAGGVIVLNGSVGGEARLSGGRIEIGPNARIAGDLYLHADEVEISPQAVITGRTIRGEGPRAREAAEAAAIGFAVFGALFALGMVLMLALINLALPGYANGAAERIRARIGTTLGIGALVLLVGPVALGLLFATLIGAPFAIALIFAYLALLAPAFAAVAYWLGLLLRGWLARKPATELPRAGGRFGWTLLGALLIVLLTALPLIGALIWLLALIAGVGAAVGHTLRVMAKGG